MPNYAVPGLMKLRDKYTNVQKVKSRLDKHIETVFESSYQTEVWEFDYWRILDLLALQKEINQKNVGERLSDFKWWNLVIGGCLSIPIITELICMNLRSIHLLIYEKCTACSFARSQKEDIELAVQISMKLN